MSDDALLQPSVPRDAPSGPRPLPWRVSSQFWVAFFGGVLAVTAVALVNAKRLGVAKERRLWMGAVATLAFALVLGLWWANSEGGTYIEALQPGRGVRMGGRVLAVLLYFALAAFQRVADARHEAVDGRYASLWMFGLAATFGLGIVQLAVVAIVATLR